MKLIIKAFLITYRAFRLFVCSIVSKPDVRRAGGTSGHTALKSLDLILPYGHVIIDVMHVAACTLRGYFDRSCLTVFFVTGLLNRIMLEILLPRPVKVSVNY